MKILFVNELDNATVSSLYASANYPATNLQHPFLRKRWQSTGSSDVISLEWSTAISFDSIYLGYTNAEGYELSIYQGASLVYQKWASIDGEPYTGREFTDGSQHYFAVSDPTGFYPGTWTGVTKIEIDIRSADHTSVVYLGGIGVGTAYTVTPNTDFTDRLWDNSSVSASDFGQSLQQYIPPGDDRTMTFADLTYITFDALKEQFKLIGEGGHLWVDIFEESHDQYPAQYSIATGFNGTRQGRLYNIVSTFREAR